MEEKIEGKLDKTFKQLHDVLRAAKLTAKDITKILLVGGSTYVPRVLSALNDDFGFDVHREVDPTYCVAIGAAIQGAIVSGEETDTILIDVNSHSLGISCLDTRPSGLVDMDHYSILIHRNTPIPASMSDIYYTCVEDQEKIEIEAYQGENPTASENTFLGSFLLENLPKRLPRDSEVEVTFEYNLNGIVEISAQEMTSGRKEKLHVDVNRITKVDGTADGAADRQRELVLVPTPEQEEAPGGTSDTRRHPELPNRKKLERILRTAQKKSQTVSNLEILEELNGKISALQRALDRGSTEAKDLSEDLAGLIADL